MIRLTPQEAAEALQVSKKTLSRYEARGLIERAPRNLHGWRIYTPALVERIAQTIYPEGVDR